MQAAMENLRNHQDTMKKREKERPLEEIHSQYQEIIRKGPYELHSKMKTWTLIDVYAFFQRPSNAAIAPKFLKGFILQNVDGDKLLEFVSKEDWEVRL